MAQVIGVLHNSDDDDDTASLFEDEVEMSDENGS